MPLEAVLSGGMDGETSRADELRALESGIGWLRLAGPCLVRVTGAGHREALQRVLSQDVLALAEGEGRLSLLLAPKGQFRAIMAVYPGERESLLLTPAGRAGELAEGLGRYLALSRCTATVEAGEAVAFLGARWPEVAAAAGVETARLAAGDRLGHDGTRWFGTTLLGAPGVLAVTRDGGALDGPRRAAGAVEVSLDAVELERIRRGWPAWGAELTDTVLPPEVGIEAQAISTTKGCYIGQETIARLETYGHPTRALAGLRQLEGSAEKPSPPVSLTPAGETRARGSLTSWGLHPALGGVGLALVKRELATPGTRLSAPGRVFEVAPFPLW